MRHDYSLDDVVIPTLMPPPGHEQVGAVLAPRLTVADLARYYRVSRATVYRWIARGQIVQPTYVGGRATWHPDVAGWLDGFPAAPGKYPREQPSDASRRATARWAASVLKRLAAARAKRKRDAAKPAAKPGPKKPAGKPVTKPLTRHSRPGKGGRP